MILLLWRFLSLLSGTYGFSKKYIHTSSCSFAPADFDIFEYSVASLVSLFCLLFIVFFLLSPCIYLCIGLFSLKKDLSEIGERKYQSILLHNDNVWTSPLNALLHSSDFHFVFEFEWWRMGVRSAENMTLIMSINDKVEEKGCLWMNDNEEDDRVFV